MNVDCQCGRCHRLLAAGMYVFEVGAFRFCQACVKKTLLVEGSDGSLRSFP